VTSGLILFILGLTAVPTAGWSSARVWVPGLVGAAALAAFVVVERRHPAPLLPPGLVAHVDVVAPNGAVALQSMVGVGWLYLLTLYLQDVRGLDALHSGLLFAPMTLASLAGAAGAGRAVLRFGPRLTSTVGLILVAAGVSAMAVTMFGDRGLTVLVSGMVVGEGGFMLTSVALTVVATGSLRREHGGLAAGLINTATQLGGGLGLALVATVVGAMATTSGVSAAGLGTGFLACLVVVAVALLIVAAGVRSPHRTRTSAGDGRSVGRTQREA
jgi:MFS family permease